MVYPLPPLAWARMVDRVARVASFFVVSGGGGGGVLWAEVCCVLCFLEPVTVVDIRFVLRGKILRCGGVWLWNFGPRVLSHS